MGENTNTNPRLQNEILHGKKIANSAGLVWSWETPAGRKRWARRVEMLTKGLDSGAQVLEIGCGTGYFTKELAKKRAHITAIDISPDLLEIAQKAVSAENVSFKLANAHSLDFVDGHFDYIVGSSVLHHFEIEKALREFSRVLKVGGKMAFTEPNMLNPQIAIQKNIPYIKEKMGDSPDETAFFRWSLASLLSECGFRNIEITPFDFLHPQIPGSLIKMVNPMFFFMERIPLVKEIAGSMFIRAQK